MPKLNKPRWLMIKEKAAVYGLDPKVVAGVLLAESANDPTAVRYEPGYKWLFMPEKTKPWNCSLTTERVLQRTSWGLMQVMGAVAREYGLTGWLTQMLQPELSVEYGCIHLSKLKHRFPDGYDYISAYNQGSPRKHKFGKRKGQYKNQGYVNKVLSIRDQLKV